MVGASVEDKGLQAPLPPVDQDPTQAPAQTQRGVNASRRRRRVATPQGGLANKDWSAIELSKLQVQAGHVSGDELKLLMLRN